MNDILGTLEEFERKLYAWWWHPDESWNIDNKQVTESVNGLTSALKPGRVTRVIRVIRVNRVTFCPGHPGQTRFKNYPGLTRIGSRETQN